MCSCCNRCCCASNQAATANALSKIEGIKLKIDAESNPLCLLPAISFIITVRGANCKTEEIEIPFSLSVAGLRSLDGGLSSNSLSTFFNALAQALPAAVSH